MNNGMESLGEHMENRVWGLIKNEKKRLLGIVIWTVLAVLLVYKMNPRPYGQYTSYLIRPIAEEKTLITSAGQSTEAYIVKDVINQLKIKNKFSPQLAQLEDDEIKSMIMVVGYSEVNMKIQEKNYLQEYERVDQLIQQAKKQKLPLIGIYLSAGKRKDDETKKLLEKVSQDADYLIVVYDEKNEWNREKEIKNQDLPISVVKKLDEIKEPLASAFR